MRTTRRLPGIVAWVVGVGIASAAGSVFGAPPPVKESALAVSALGPGVVEAKTEEFWFKS